MSKCHKNGNNNTIKDSLIYRFKVFSSIFNKKQVLFICGYSLLHIFKQILTIITYFFFLYQKNYMY